MSYCQGDTVWLKATFQDREGNPEDRTSVTLKVFADGKAQVGDTIQGEEILHVGTGVYEYAYTLPIGYNTLVYEFSGTDAEGKVQLSRARIEPIWAE